MSSERWPAWAPGRDAVLAGLPRVFGHRGAAGHAPENTLASIRRAAALGATAVEFDVKLSRNGRAILMHDDRLGRTTDGTGYVKRHDYDALAALDAGSWFAPEFAGERAPSLEAALDLVLQLGLEANVEIKPCRGREIETAERVMDVLLDRWPATRPAPLVSSFSRASLAVAKNVAPAFPRGLLVERLPHDWPAAMRELGCATLNMSHRHADEARLARLGRDGVAVLLYTVNDAGRARDLFAWGAAALFTDAPDRILPVAPAAATPAQ